MILRGPELVAKTCATNDGGIPRQWIFGKQKGRKRETHHDPAEALLSGLLRHHQAADFPRIFVGAEVRVGEGFVGVLALCLRTPHAPLGHERAERLEIAREDCIVGARETAVPCE
jgi:hypothetical protein